MDRSQRYPYNSSDLLMGRGSELNTADVVYVIMIFGSIRSAPYEA